jgi:protein SCO1/2
MLGKPLVLVLSYYDCDGACPTINRNLRATLQDVNDWRLGKDFKVLTLSFDRHDNPQTLAMFLQHVGFENGLPEGWNMAMLKEPDDIRRLTDSIGYRFFWEPRDRLFLHPNVYIMLSPEGRVTRFLYGGSISAEDMEYSITKAFGSELTAANVINFVIGACFSYNYKDGKYTLNYPIFIAFGALGIGIVLLIWGSLIMKRREYS